MRGRDAVLAMTELREHGQVFLECDGDAGVAFEYVEARNALDYDGAGEGFAC